MDANKSAQMRMGMIGRGVRACLPRLLILFVGYTGVAADKGTVTGQVYVRSATATVRPLSGVNVFLLPADVASNTYRERLASAAAQLAGSEERRVNLCATRKDLENEKTLKVYRRMFSETGPAEREQLAGEIEEINREMANLDLHLAELDKTIARLKSPAALFTPRWDSAISSVKTDDEGKFTLGFPQNGSFWIGAYQESALGQQAGPYGWLMPLRRAEKHVYLCETNMVQCAAAGTAPLQSP